MSKARWQESESRSLPRKPAGSSASGRWKGAREVGAARTSLQIFAGLFALAAVLTIAVVLLLYLYPIAPPRLVVIHASYHSPLLPPNTYADRDIEAMVAEKAVFETTFANPQPLTGNLIRAQLHSLPEFQAWQRWLRWEKNHLLVYVNAYGVSLWDPARKQVQPYLLGSDFEIPVQQGSPEQFGAIPLREVLEAVADCNADRKLLVLDCQRLDHHWPMGMFRNDFVTAAQVAINELPPEKRQDLYVLFSCSPGERTHYDPVVGMSVFGRCFLEAMTGAGDPANGTGDRRIQLDELVSYTQQQVQQWTLKHRANSQTPLLVAPDQQQHEPLTLVALSSSQQPFAATPVTDEPGRQDVVDQLQQAWREYFELSAQTPPPHVYGPRIWRYAQDTLLRSERFLLAEQLKAAAEEAANALARVRKVSETRAKMAVTGQGYSVAMARFLERSRTPAGGSQLGSAPVEIPGIPTPFDEVGLEDYVAVLRDIRQGRDFNAALTRLDADVTQRSIVPVEILTAQMLQKHLLSTAQPSPALLDQARAAVALAELAETTAAPPHIDAPKITRWGRTNIELADSLRLQQLDRLFASNGNPVYTQNAIQASEADPAEIYKKAQAAQAIVSEANMLRLQLLAELPHLVRYASSSTDGSDDLLAALEGVLESARQLDTQLQTDPIKLEPENIESAVESLRTLHTDLKSRYSQITQRIQKQLQQLAGSSGPATSAQEWKQIERLLQLPFASQPDDASESASARIRLIERLRQPIQFAQESDEAVTAEPTSGEQAYQVRIAEKFIFLRNGRSVDLEPMTVEQIGVELGQSWRQAYLWAMQDSFQTAEEDWLHRVETATRLFDGFIAQVAGASCMEELRKRRLAEFFLWHAQRAARDFWASLQDGAEPYFSLVAQRYLQLAVQNDPNGFLTGPIQEQTRNLELLRQVPKQVQMLALPSKIRLIEQDTIPLRFRVDFPDQTPVGIASFSVSADNGNVNLTKAPEDSSRTDQVSFTLARAARSGKTQLQTSVLFRGHRSSSATAVELVDDEAGPTVTYVNDKPADGTVRLRLAADQRSDVNLLFVLDCSSSMQQNQRMSILKQVLNQFSRGVARNSLNVGIQVLGDQVVWTEDTPEAEADARVDTRLLLPIGPFDPQTFESVVSQLHAVGSTPLFYALLQAKQAFANVKMGPKRIIVISDGADNWASVQQRPNIQDLREAYRDSDIEINAIGFQVDDPAYSQLQSIAGATGGVAVRAEQADTLFKYVTGLQGAVFYSIVGPSMRTEPEILTTKTQPLRLPTGNYTVQLADYAGKSVAQDFPLRLARGEKHELLYYRGVISYAPVQAVAQVTDPESRVTFAVLTAERQQSALRLQVALYKADQPTWRPETVSLFVRSPKTMDVYPLQHLPPNAEGYHVPVWDFQAENWPIEADRADFQIFWADRLGESLRPVTLRWGEQPVAGNVPPGMRIAYRPIQSRDVASRRGRSALVKAVFPPGLRDQMNQWSIRTGKEIQAAKQIFFREEGIYTGLFILNGEADPEQLLIFPPPLPGEMKELKLTVGVSVPIIPQ